jgi:hypothetical protein
MNLRAPEVVAAAWKAIHTTGGAAFFATCGLHRAPAAAAATIFADEPAALMDAEVAIKLRGLPPRQPVIVTAVQTYPSGSRWQARATFMSDASGNVDIARQAPISGTYDGVSAMGLIWSAERLPGAATAPPPGFIMRPWLVSLEATGPDGTRAETTLERRAAGAGVTRHQIRSEGIVGTLFLPPGEGPHPAVLVVNGGGGGIDEYRGAMLASHGYAALNLGYFAMEGLPRGLVNVPLEYFENTIRWMRAQSWLRDQFSWQYGASRAAANWPCCSAPPSPTSTR